MDRRRERNEENRRRAQAPKIKYNRERSALWYCSQKRQVERAFILQPKRLEYPAAFVMNHYAKGANFERKIVSDFWAHGFAAMRAAGSGTTRYPVPDVIAVKGGRVILVECKATKKDRLSLKDNMLELKKFADISCAEAYIAMKFYKKEPRFYGLDIQLAKGNYTITENDPFMSLDQVLSEQRTL